MAETTKEISLNQELMARWDSRAEGHARMFRKAFYRVFYRGQFGWELADEPGRFIVDAPCETRSIIWCCEICHKVSSEIDCPVGWTQCGESRFGGVASYCDNCTTVG